MNKPKYGYAIYGVKTLGRSYYWYLEIKNKKKLKNFNRYLLIKDYEYPINVIHGFYELVQDFNIRKDKLVEYINQLRRIAILDGEEIDEIDENYMKNFINTQCKFKLIKIIERDLEQELKFLIKSSSSVSNGYNFEQDIDYEQDVIEKGGEYYVYRHISPSNKSYIGITKDIKKRWYGKGKGYVTCTKFNNAIKKYGWDNFKHEILEKNLSKEEAYNMEKFYIKKFDSIANGYNISEGGNDTKFL